MENKIQNNMKEVGLAFVMGLIVAVGFIASAGSINYGVANEGWLFTACGIVDLFVTVYAAVAFYKRFLKPID